MARLNGLLRIGHNGRPPAASASMAKTSKRKIERRKSEIHGNGVFAIAPIAKG